MEYVDPSRNQTTHHLTCRQIYHVIHRLSTYFHSSPMALAKVRFNQGKTTEKKQKKREEKRAREKTGEGIGEERRGEETEEKEWMKDA